MSVIGNSKVDPGRLLIAQQGNMADVPGDFVHTPN
jgi:hypothetical protein